MNNAKIFALCGLGFAAALFSLVMPKLPLWYVNSVRILSCIYFAIVASRSFFAQKWLSLSLAVACVSVLFPSFLQEFGRVFCLVTVCLPAFWLVLRWWNSRF